MALKGETVGGGAPRRCDECGQDIIGPQVMRTCAYYIGYECGCGPYSRETGYFTDRAAAERALAEMKAALLPHPPFDLLEDKEA